MDDSGDGPEFNKVGCFRATASWSWRSETHNLMGVKIWGQKACNHGHQKQNTTHYSYMVFALIPTAVFYCTV